MGTEYPTPARGNKLTVSFGLVNVGVKYAPLVDAKGRLAGTYLDPKSHLPVKQQYVNDKGEVVKHVTGYAYGSGYVVPDPEDVKALELARDSRLELKAFVDPATVDPLYLEKAYLVFPDKGNEAGYDLLCAVLEVTGKALVGTTVIRKSTKAIMLRYAQGCLLAHACTYDKNVTWGDQRLVAMGHAERPTPAKDMVEMALTLFSGLPGEFDFSAVEDEYDARLRAAIEGLAQGKKVERPVEEAQLPTGDLMEALKASVAAAREKLDAEAKPKRSRKKAAA